MSVVKNENTVRIAGFHEVWQRGLQTLTHEQRAACVRVLTEKDFWKSETRFILIDWLETLDKGKADFPTPFSNSRWRKLGVSF